METTLKNIPTNFSHKFKALQLTFQVVLGVEPYALLKPVEMQLIGVLQRLSTDLKRDQPVHTGNPGGEQAGLR